MMLQRICCGSTWNGCFIAFKNVSKQPKMLWIDHSQQEQSVWNALKQPFDVGAKCTEWLFQSTQKHNSEVSRMLQSNHLPLEHGAWNGCFKAFKKWCVEATKNAANQPFTMGVKCVECFNVTIHYGSQVHGMVASKHWKMPWSDQKCFKATIHCGSELHRMLQTDYSLWEWSVWNGCFEVCRRVVQSIQKLMLESKQ